MFGFVLGTGRCGSTLVQELIARHHDVGFVSNIEDRFALPAAAGRFNRVIYDRVPARFTEKGRVRFAPSEAYRILERQVSPLIAVSPHDLTDAGALGPRFRAFFEQRAAMQRKKLFLHKFTGWPRVGLIDATLGDDTRYVHVVRDGRAVASSWLQMSWWIGDPQRWQWGALPDAYAHEWERSGRDPVLLAGLCWKMLIDSFDAARADESRWLEIRYEDVVAEPEKTLRGATEHLGLDWSAELAAAVARHRFSAAATTKWRSELGDQLDASLATHLERFGYES